MGGNMLKGGKGGQKSGGNVKKVFVGGLPKEPNEQAIRDFFSQYGNISELKMIQDENGLSKGYCFVTFEDVASAKMALENAEGNIVDGKWVDVKPSEAEGPKPGDWYCPNCGDLVFAKRSSCNMCGYSGGGGRPALTGAQATPKGSKPGDWICKNCSNVNFSNRTECNKCAAPKPEDVQRVGMKPGDWTCPGCGDLVFASKNACKMCGTPKPSGMGGMGRFSPY
mmetsp:Transcript_22119/g.44549  ORF Transcript_22119/g.44549 Transcript_22119/m.44549 type:complete len:224 (+) Transcript_22119:2-673(+)